VCRIEVPDGTGAAAGDALLSLSGPARGILVAERTALNLMQRLCGVATLTRRFVDAVKAYGTEILDTRKTTPGLRVLEKYAVRCGGGSNHRMGLYDRVLMKDNHRGLWRSGLGDDLDQAVQAARQAFPGIPVEIEVETEVELESALRASPEWVLLDNMGPDALARCVQLCGGRSRLEASGGITMENVAAVAQSGVDAISLGCLTHSAPAVDLSLELAG
jgi:nicotinate-nucleotide pyrophosphorylase (carboxylating)